MNELNKKNGKPTFAFAALLRKDFFFLAFSRCDMILEKYILTRYRVSIFVVYMYIRYTYIYFLFVISWLLLQVRVFTDSTRGGFFCEWGEIKVFL